MCKTSLKREKKRGLYPTGPVRVRASRPPSAGQPEATGQISALCSSIASVRPVVVALFFFYYVKKTEFS